MRRGTLLIATSILAGCQSGPSLFIANPSLADSELVIPAGRTPYATGFRLRVLEASERQELAEFLGSEPIPSSTLLEQIHGGRLFLFIGQIGHSGRLTGSSAKLQIGEVAFDLNAKRLRLEMGREPLEIALVGDGDSAVGPLPIIWNDQVYGIYWIEPNGTTLRVPKLSPR